MKFHHLLPLALLALYAAQAQAQCPIRERLTSEYGISFQGFEKPLAAAAQPAGGDLLLLPVVQPRFASDGFAHTIVVSASRLLAWVHRTGGLAGVNEWYGPLGVDAASLAGCPHTPGPEHFVKPAVAARDPQ